MILHTIKHFINKKKENRDKVTNIGILYLCTGKYDVFFEQFYLSFNKKFVSDSHKTFFVFTDSERLKLKFTKYKDVKFINIQHMGWPLGTLLRNKYFFENFELFTGNHFLFFCNANLVCIDPIYLDELGLGTGTDMCGVQHPYFFQKYGEEMIVEKEKDCNAFFTKEEIATLQNYFQGCFYGGNFKSFKKLVDTIYKWTEEDLNNNIMPIWFDESYLNRYFFLHPPHVLNSGFAYPENAQLPFKMKIMQLEKKKIDKTFFNKE